MSRFHFTQKELDDFAAQFGLRIQHECGGYRLVKRDGSTQEDVFPRDGVCPTVARLACYIFLCGVDYKSKSDRGLWP